MSLQDKITELEALAYGLNSTIRMGISSSQLPQITGRLTRGLEIGKGGLEDAKTILDDHETRIAALESP